MPKLRLKVTHTHAGVAYPSGHVIEVDDHTARWLIDQQIGVIETGDTEADTATSPVLPQTTRAPRNAVTSKE